MSTVKSFKIGNTSYPVEDDSAIKFLTAAQRTQLLAEGTYNGTAIASGTCFVTDVGTVEQFTITGGGSSPISNITVSSTNQPPGVDGGCVSYLNGSLVALTNYEVHTSTDGITWTYRGSAPVNGGNMYKLYNVNGTLVTFETMQMSYAEIYTSTDGVTWTTVSLPFSYPYDNVRACNGVLFAGNASDATVIMYSTDAGVTWNSIQTTAASISLYKVIYVNGRYVFLAESNSGYVDATTFSGWTDIAFFDNSYAYEGFNAPDGSWAVVYMQSDNSLYRTTDGATYTAVSGIALDQPTIWGGTLDGVGFIVDTSSYLCYITTDGLNYTTQACGASSALMAGTICDGSIKMWLTSTVENYGTAWIMTYDGGSSGPSYSLTPLSVPAEVVQTLPVSPTSGKVYFVTGSA